MSVCQAHPVPFAIITFLLLCQPDYCTGLETDAQFPQGVRYPATLQILGSLGYFGYVPRPGIRHLDQRDFDCASFAFEGLCEHGGWQEQ